MATRKNTKKTAKKTSVKTSVAKKSSTKLTTGGKVWRVIVCLLVPMIVGGISGFLAMNAMGKFGEMNQPPLAPPAWLFPVAWTLLYILMGLASYLIFVGGEKDHKKIKTVKAALVIYGIQLIFNFCWSLIFFNFKLYWFAFGWLVVMWILILVLMIKAGKVSRGAVLCLLPYILWCSFALYLNAGVALLN